VQKGFAMSRPVDLSQHGLSGLGTVHANLSAPDLVEMALARNEANLTDAGALTAITGKRTGRSPRDKFIVREASVQSWVDWGRVNQPMQPEVFARLLQRARDFARGKEFFVQDSYACADPAHRLHIRVVAQKAWHALFAQCLFRRLSPAEQLAFQPDWLVLALPELLCEPTRDGTHSETVVALSFEQKIVLIAGTHYAGEIKKSVFSILNAILPAKDVFPMHCSANIGAKGDVALFFGLSGTGKTTLSADPERRLIGDDEHGWSDDGVFNIEGGCYAKTIRLSATGEPQIWNAIRFGSVLENVPLDPHTRVPNYNSDQYTENTRCAYPIEFIPNAEPTGRGGHPSNIFFLACDAFGVLPPLAKLTPDQAMEHFLLGYTAKVAGTETGVKAPQATFSTCFAAPFLPLAPRRYAELLKERMQKHNAPVWLVNTGWTGGPSGVGKRMNLQHTRALLKAALDGSLNKVAFSSDSVFHLQIPKECPGVPPEVLQPRSTWSDPQAYDAAARRLVEMFQNPAQIES
jgi:phosphoenolpyruvate carboxykinase (ATP)